MDFIDDFNNTLDAWRDAIVEFLEANQWINPFSIFLIVIGLLVLYMVIVSFFDSLRNRNEWKKKGYSSKKEYERAQEEQALATIGIDTNLTDTQAKYLNMLEETWENDSAQVLKGQANTNFIRQTELNLDVLRRNRLDRDFAFEPKRQLTYYPSQTDYKSDGRVKRHQIELAGSSSYIWKDLRSGQTLLTKEYDSSIIHFNTASGVYDSSGRSVCKNCGAPVDAKNFDTYECPYCSSIIYKSDYEDLLSSYSILGLSASEERARQRAEVTDASQMNRFLLFAIPALIIVVLVIGVIILLALRAAGNETASNIVGVGTILMAIIISVSAFLRNDKEASKKLADTAKSTVRDIASQETTAERIEREEEENLSELVSDDPEFSIDLAISEAIFMFQSLWLDRHRSKQTWGVFTSQEGRSNLVQHHEQDGEILDLVVNESVFNDYSKDADGQKIRIYISYDLLLPISNSSLKLENRELMLNLVRNTDGTSVVLDDHSECSSCGAPVDIMTMSSCSYCNTGLLRDSFLWRINDLEPVDSEFKSRLDEKRKIRPKSSFRNILREI